MMFNVYKNFPNHPNLEKHDCMKKVPLLIGTPDPDSIQDRIGMDYLMSLISLS